MNETTNDRPTAEPQTPPPQPPTAPEEPALEALERTLATERERVKQAEDQMLRALAEAENQRKRAARELEERVRYANETLLLGLLPALDDLERSVSASRGAIDVEQLRKGVELTLSQFLKALKNAGVEPIAAERGAPFDPAIHEALAQDDAAELPEHRISVVVSPGFRYHGRILRPARVTVSSGRGAPPRCAPGP
jgi:molecular chaperone GrpE